MLDEPTEGVWIGVIEEIGDRLIELSRTISIVIVEQHLKLALRVADQACVMDRGHVVLKGPSAEIMNDPRLLRILAP
jgi:branched-chain amino acid transport system ATP-binding protein